MCQKHFACIFVLRGVFKDAVGNWNWCRYSVKLLGDSNELDDNG